MKNTTIQNCTAVLFMTLGGSEGQLAVIVQFFVGRCKVTKLIVGVTLGSIALVLAPAVIAAITRVAMAGVIVPVVALALVIIVTAVPLVLIATLVAAIAESPCLVVQRRFAVLTSSGNRTQGINADSRQTRASRSVLTRELRQREVVHSRKGTLTVLRSMVLHKLSGTPPVRNTNDRIAILSDRNFTTQSLAQILPVIVRQYDGQLHLGNHPLLSRLERYFTDGDIVNEALDSSELRTFFIEVDVIPSRARRIVVALVVTTVLVATIAALVVRIATITLTPVSIIATVALMLVAAITSLIATVVSLIVSILIVSHCFCFLSFLKNFLCLYALELSNRDELLQVVLLLCTDPFLLYSYICFMDFTGCLLRCLSEVNVVGMNLRCVCALDLICPGTSIYNDIHSLTNIICDKFRTSTGYDYLKAVSLAKTPRVNRFIPFDAQKEFDDFGRFAILDHPLPSRIGDQATLQANFIVHK